MLRRNAAIQTGLILSFVAGLAGCSGPDAGTIKADRGTRQQLDRGNAVRTKPSMSSKTSRKPQDDILRSPKAPGGESLR